MLHIFLLITVNCTVCVVDRAQVQVKKEAQVWKRPKVLVEEIRKIAGIEFTQVFIKETVDNLHRWKKKKQMKMGDKFKNITEGWTWLGGFDCILVQLFWKTSFFHVIPLYLKRTFLVYCSCTADHNYQKSDSFLQAFLKQTHPKIVWWKDERNSRHTVTVQVWRVMHYECPLVETHQTANHE